MKKKLVLILLLTSLFLVGCTSKAKQEANEKELDNKIAQWEEVDKKKSNELFPHIAPNFTMVDHDYISGVSTYTAFHNETKVEYIITFIKGKQSYISFTQLNNPDGKPKTYTK